MITLDTFKVDLQTRLQSHTILTHNTFISAKTFLALSFNVVNTYNFMGLQILTGFCFETSFKDSQFLVSVPQISNIIDYIGSIILSTFT